MLTVRSAANDGAVCYSFDSCKFNCFYFEGRTLY